MKKNWLTGKELCDRWKIDTEELYGIIRDGNLPLYDLAGKLSSLDAILLPDELSDAPVQKPDPEQYKDFVNLPEKVLYRMFHIKPNIARLNSALLWHDDIEALESKHPRLCCLPPGAQGKPSLDPNLAAVNRFYETLKKKCRPWTSCPLEKRKEYAREIIRANPDDYLPLTIGMMSDEVFEESSGRNEKRDIRKRLMKKISSNFVNDEFMRG